MEQVMQVASEFFRQGRELFAGIDGLNEDNNINTF
jgi:hypothetical protein